MVFDASPISAAVAVRNRAGGSVAFRNGSTVTVAAGTTEAVTLHGNMGEITFDWSADPKKRKVNHTIRWRSSEDIGEDSSSSEPDPVQFTDYVVSLDPDDADFSEITPRAMP